VRGAGPAPMTNPVPALGAGLVAPGLIAVIAAESPIPVQSFAAPFLDIRAVKSSILERNVISIGDVFAL
jgi:hypothetical protein